MAEHGGNRENAGRPKGRRSRKTLEKLKVAEAFNQLVLKQADKLFLAQSQIALGSMNVIRVEEEDDGNGKVKRVHTRVTSPDEIIGLLDECDGLPGSYNGKYYFFTDVLPDNRALDSLLNRALGKPTDKMDFTSNGETITFSLTPTSHEKAD